MPIIIPNDLPAALTLASENIFTMTDFRAVHQDIRPLKIGILNLMPTKETTETQLLRVLGNTPLQTEIVLIQVDNHLPKNTSSDYLSRFYVPFSQIKEESFDGLIITGAPVETLEYEDVSYWESLEEILQWSRKHCFSTFHICWGAQVALYKHYGIPKYPLQKKCFGVFQHSVREKNVKLLRGFDDVFAIPQSRHTEIRIEDVNQVEVLTVVAYSEESGIGLIVSKDGREVYATGHSEYDATTLADEYFRDLERGLSIDVPAHYFKENNPHLEPEVKWRAHAHLLFANWLNYYVYQETPYDIHNREF